MDVLKRFGVAAIVTDLAAAGLSVAGVAKALARAGINRVLRHESGHVFGAGIAKSLETVVTETPGDADVKARVAGALAVNAQLTCDEIKDAFTALSKAQADLEKARGGKDEAAKRDARESAEAALISAVVKLGQLSD